MNKFEAGLQQLKKIGVFTREEAEQLNVEWGKLKYLIKKGLVERVDTGIYWHRESSVPSENIDFIAASLRFGPDAVVGGLTALFYYGLIREVPGQIWVCVPAHQSTRSPRGYRIIRTKYDLRLGIETHKRFKMTSIERTLLDALRYQSKMGLSLAYEAFHTAFRERRSNMKKIGVLADQLGWRPLLIKHMAALSMESNQ